jgi:hypothetical protein
MASIALEQGTKIDADHAVRSLPALGARKAVGPAGGDHGLCTVHFRAEAAQELRQRHAVLELNSVHCHGQAPSWNASSLCGP